MGDGRFVPRMRVIGAWAEGAWISGKPGVCTVIWLVVTEETRASFDTPLTVKMTRVVAGEPKKRPPFRTSAVPPSFGPKLGLQKETNGRLEESVWKLMTSCAEFVRPWTVAVALTLAVPALGPQRAVVAVPLVVTTEITG